MEYIFSENQIFSNSLFHFEYMHLMYQYYISCRSVAPSWKNLNDDLEATVPPILKKNFNLWRTKICASFGLINMNKLKTNFVIQSILFANISSFQTQSLEFIVKTNIYLFINNTCCISGIFNLLTSSRKKSWNKL